MKNQKLILLLAIVISVCIILMTYINTKKIQNLDRFYISQIKLLETKTSTTIKNMEKNSTNKIKILKQNSSKELQNLETDVVKRLQKLNKQINSQSHKSKVTNSKLHKAITFLDKEIKNQTNIFLEERKKDILFLSRIKLNQQIINSFFHTSKLNNSSLYKEVSFFNLKGKEIYKKSKIETLKMNIYKKENTFCKKEDYSNDIKELQEGQVFVSNTISCRNNNSIIRIITPIIRKFKKVGYLSVAIDYKHINKLENKINTIKKEVK